MNRQQRRRAERERRRLLSQQPRPSETSEHATVMVVDHCPWSPFIETPYDSEGHTIEGRMGEKIYRNSRYQVAVYPPAPCSVENFPAYVHLCFKHIANIAITDFRDFQRIKNELIHPSAYAFQVYPPEENLVDGANQYHLWVLVPGCYPEIPEDDGDWPCMPYGFFSGRHVTDEAPQGGRQRTFEDPPETIAQDRQRVRNQLEEYRAGKAIEGILKGENQ